VIFILQDKVFGEETDRLIAALEDNGVEYHIGIPNSVYAGGYYFVRGSIEFYKEFDSSFGEYCDPESLCLGNYVFSKYSKHFGPRLLNDDYVILPWWKLYFSDSYLFPESESLFIRPNSGEKIFTGTTLTKKWWKQELDIIKNLPSTYGLTDETLVVVSTVKEIIAEYRIFMKRDKLIDFSIYEGDEISMGDAAALRFWADSLDFYPDRYYTVDIAKTPKSYKLIEINSGISAGWYDMDYNKIVEEIKSE